MLRNALDRQRDNLVYSIRSDRAPADWIIRRALKLSDRNLEHLTEREEKRSAQYIEGRHGVTCDDSSFVTRVYFEWLLREFRLYHPRRFQTFRWRKYQAIPLFVARFLIPEDYRGPAELAQRIIRSTSQLDIPIDVVDQAIGERGTEEQQWGWAAKHLRYERLMILERARLDLDHETCWGRWMVTYCEGTNLQVPSRMNTVIEPQGGVTLALDGDSQEVVDAALKIADALKHPHNSRVDTLNVHVSVYRVNNAQRDGLLEAFEHERKQGTY